MNDAEVADLYERHGYALFRRCLGYLGEEAAAQDAVQEVFVRALRSSAGFRGDADPKTWLSRIADHLCIDLVRRHRRSPIDREPAPEAELGSALIQNDDPEAILSVRRLMAALDPPSRRLATLYFVDELTQDEIARETGISRKTIGKRLRDLAERAKSFLGGTEHVS